MTAFLFVPLLAATWIYGLFYSGLASHYFLTIVESSGSLYAQNVDWKKRSFRSMMHDGIEWPEVQYLDWFWKGLYMLYLVGVWLGPGLLLARWAVGPTVWATVLIGVFFWLTFPISILSTMLSSSKWNPCWPPLFICILQRPMQTFCFYMFSLVPMAVVVVAVDVLLVHQPRDSFVISLVLAPMAIGFMFVYARLLGRLGLALSFTLPAEETEPEPEKKRKPKRPRPTHEYDEATRWSMPTEAVDHVAADAQPSDLPPVETPFDGPVTGYNVDYSDRPAPEVKPKPPKIMHFDDDDDSPINVAPPEEVNTTERQRVTDELAKPPQHVMDLYMRERPEEPDNPYGSSAITFLFDPKTVQEWAAGTVGLIFLAVLLHALNVLRPIE